MEAPPPALLLLAFKLTFPPTPEPIQNSTKERLYKARGSNGPTCKPPMLPRGQYHHYHPTLKIPNLEWNSELLYIIVTMGVACFLFFLLGILVFKQLQAPS